MPEIKQTSILCQFSLRFEEMFVVETCATDTARLRQVQRDSSLSCFIRRKAVRRPVLILAIALVLDFILGRRLAKARLNKGNTPLHLAMESAHGETAALLIEAGADRSRVRLLSYFFCG